MNTFWRHKTLFALGLFVWSIIVPINSKVAAYQLPYFGEECDMTSITSLSPSVFNLGDTVTVEGFSFGNRDLDDSIPETIILMDGNGASAQISRTFADVGGIPEYHGILSWSDDQIQIEIPTNLTFTSGYLAVRIYTTTESSSSQYICGSPDIEASSWYLAGYEPEPTPTGPVVSSYDSLVYFNEQIEINGENFGQIPGIVMPVGSQYDLYIYSWSNNLIIANTSDNGVLDEGQNQLIVRSSNGEESAPFTVTMAYQQPTINSISPSTIYSGDEITIYGSGFGDVPGYITISGVSQIQEVTSWTSTQIRIRTNIPSPGQFNLAINTSSTQSNFLPITVQSACSEDTWVCTDWTTCSSNNQARTCQITLDCPVIDTLSPSTTQSCTSNPVASPTLTPSPTITALSPSTIYQGTQVTINGYDFGTYGAYGYSCATCKVLVNGTSATISYNYSYSYEWTDTSITFQMPQNATDGSIQIIDKNGNTSNSFDFSISINPADIPPTITSISPQAISPGDTITIVGNNFGSSQGYSKLATDSFVANGTIVSWTDNEIRYKTSTYFDAISKKIGVQKCKSYYVCLDVVYGDYFYIQPQIKSLEFEKGPIGMEVAIYGNYFKNSNVVSDTSNRYSIDVYFGGIEAIITEWTSQRLKAVVPSGAKDGNVTVKITSDGTNDYVIATGPYFDIWDNISDDEYSYLQTYFKQINIPDAWTIAGGRRRIIVAVIDDGVYSNHPDFQENMWKNTNEIQGNGKDDDKNGYIDDVFGWDFFYNTADITPTGSHGTQVAGIIGADSNNEIGIAGVNWNVEIMPLIVADENDNLIDWEGIGNAIKYATDNGAEVINLSLGSSGISGFSTEIDEAIKYAYDRNVLLVVAAGNGDEFDQGYDLNRIPQSPVCNDGNKNMVIGVGAVDVDNYRTTWSNYGTKCVDIWAPGVAIVSTAVPAYSSLGGFYDIANGTSFSAPIVTGIVSLLKATYPTLTSEEAIRLLISNANNGVVDAYATLNEKFAPSNVDSNKNEDSNNGTGISITSSNEENPFSDLPASNRNKNAILYLYKEGIINGYPDKTFKPENTVNRAELLKILVEGQGISPSIDNYKNCFPDVKTDWYAPYVCYAKSFGWVEGYPDGTFKPAQTVNKVEALKMLLNSQRVNIAETVVSESFNDVKKGDWFAQYVYKAKSLGILEEIGSLFYPADGMKRGGICENLFRLLTF